MRSVARKNAARRLREGAPRGGGAPQGGEAQRGGTPCGGCEEERREEEECSA
jgi:hypothetical protein